MKTENLDALLLDRALGQLAPEVIELLDEHLAQHPAAAVRAAKLQATVALAGAAVAVPVDDAAGLAERRFAGARRTAGMREIARELLKVAACVAIGLGAGWSLRSGTPKGAEIRRDEIVRAIPPSKVESPATAFWSRERLEAQGVRAPRRPPLPWPVAVPPRREDKS